MLARHMLRSCLSVCLSVCHKPVMYNSIQKVQLIEFVFVYRVHQWKQFIRKKYVFQPCEYRFEPNFQTLYVGIQATYSANFIKITHMIQQI